jgi:hypothetical protein
MTKKILVSTLIFISCTAVFTLVFFPYSKVLEYYANKAASNAGITLTAKTINAGVFGADLNNVKLNEFHADSINLIYSPLSVITRNVGAKVISDIVTGEVTLKGNNINLKTLLSTDKIPQVAASGLKGDIILNLALADLSGEGTIASPKLTIPTDMGPINIENITGDLTIDKMNMITINNLKSTGSTVIDLRGNIRVNRKNAGKSAIAITGTISVAGMTKRLSITGPALEPKIILN